MEVKKRFVSLDILRVFSCLSVISVHFFLNGGFYSQPIVGWEMVTMLFLRCLFIICVPLFIMITGYLQNNKTPCLEYYKKIWRILGIYFFSALACGIYRCVNGQYASVRQIVYGILNFTAAKYGWYVEMYLGLFLLIPFLNLVYLNLKAKNEKLLLIGTLLFMTSLPMLVNTFRFGDAAWWNEPRLSAQYQKLIPQWWNGFYPVTFYYLGAYLREYPIKLSRLRLAGLTLLTVSSATLFNYWRSHPGVFIWGNWNNWQSPFTVLTAVFVFSFILQCGEKRKRPKSVDAVLRFLSKISFGTYLVSFIFDDVFYPKLAKRVPEITARLPYLPLMVICVFTASAALSAVIYFIYRGFSMLWKLIRPYLLKRTSCLQK
ncbi:MAG: acyltransferase family protein [Clostridiales bacterium]|nr:acyltransferase family protein [Clostridiales bacterium]